MKNRIKKTRGKLKILVVIMTIISLIPLSGCYLQKRITEEEARDLAKQVLQDECDESFQIIEIDLRNEGTGVPNWKYMGKAKGKTSGNIVKFEMQQDGQYFKYSLEE